MARRLLSCCRVLGCSYSSNFVCQQLPRIAGLVQPWVATDEPSLKHLLSYNLTKCHGARVVADDWSLNGQTNLGLGDLVAELPCGAHLVIETKYLNVRTTGPTAQRRRSHHRSYVARQAQTYGKLWQEMLQQKGDNRPVICASFDNETGLKYHAPPGPEPAASAVGMEAAALEDTSNLAGHHGGEAAQQITSGVEATVSQDVALGFEDSNSSTSSCSGGDSSGSGPARCQQQQQQNQWY